MLIELVRAIEPDRYAEDPTGADAPADVPIAINPEAVAAILGSTGAPGVTIVRLMDGRGFKVRGDYHAVKEALAAGGRVS
ncbi:MAG TPA: hypothetical protein VNN79_06150 [Actinomycetota bacterium]|nr:hypothetical protein [Actinomycetota bacterium]